MFFLLLSAFFSLSRSQTFSYAWSSVTSERNVRVVFDGAGCSGYGRVEVWKNNAWNALSDCYSTGRYFTTSEADAVCEQVGYSFGAVSGGYRFYTSLSGTSALRTGSTTPSNRLYAGTMSCSTRSSSEFCDGCSISTSTSTSRCSSSVYRSTSSSTSSPGMWSGSRVYNRDVFVDCFGTQSSGSCIVVTGTSALYSSTHNPTAGQCNLSRTGTTAGSVAGAIIGIIFGICYCCCCLGAIIFFFFGGTLAICECLRPRSRPAPATTGMVVTTVATNQSTAVAQTEGYGQTSTTNAPATAVGYGQPVGQPVQYGAAPGYETAPAQGYPPAQAGYPPQGYAQPVAVAGAPGYAQPAGGYAPGYAPTGGAPPQYGQPAAAPGVPPAYVATGGAAPGYAPQNPPPY